MAKIGYLVALLMLWSAAAKADQQPTFWCGFIGPPADSGYRIVATNGGQRNDSADTRPYQCTVTCAMRTSDSRGFTSFTCTGKVHIYAQEEEICRDGPGLDGAPFSEATISNFSCTDLY